MKNLSKTCKNLPEKFENFFIVDWDNENSKSKKQMKTV